jgi:phosphatidate cytidylyltransferase
MLGQRIITALLLLAVLLPAVFYPDTRVFAAITVLLLAAAAWEWARLNGQSNPLAWFSGAIFALCCIGFWMQGGVDDAVGRYHWVWSIAALVWVLGGAWLLRGGVPAWSGLPVALRWPLGWLALAVAWLAVNQARALGVNFLFSVLALVWVADSAAYFSGRALGGRFFARKLAPSISPGKTWEGVCGGMLGVLVLAWVWHQADVHFGLPPSIYTHLWSQSGMLLLLGGVFLTAMSVVGDLVESLFKRSAGVKDSSALLPGHGGVLDRIDALLPTLPIAMMLMQR